MPQIIPILLIIGSFIILIGVIMLLKIELGYCYDVNPLSWIVICGAIILITGFILLGHYKVRSVKADLINKEFGTNYTYKEVFWGGQVIQDMIEGELERKELSGKIEIETK